MAKKEKEVFLKWAEDLEYNTFKIPRADYVIFLYVPFKIAQKLIKKKAARSYLNGKSKDQYEENVLYLQKVEKMYLWMAAQNPNWIKIDCVVNEKLLSKEEIHKKIVLALEKI